MARISYSDAVAAAFQASRELPPDALSEWRAAISRHLAPRRGMLRPGAPVLIRSAFPGRHHGIGLFRYWPEAIAALDTFPSIASVRTAFATAGFSYVTLEPVRQVTAPSLAAIAATARREAHTPLMLISDDAYQAGLARLRAAAATQPGPVIDTLDLLVLRAGRTTVTAPPPASPATSQSTE